MLISVDICRFLWYNKNINNLKEIEKNEQPKRKNNRAKSSVD